MGIISSSCFSDFEGTFFRPVKHCVVLLKRGEVSPLFIRALLTQEFKLSAEDAKSFVRDIYDYGYAEVGAFTAEVAEHKVWQINDIARDFDEPLMAAYDGIVGGYSPDQP